MMLSRSVPCTIRYASRGHGLFPRNCRNSSRLTPSLAATNPGATSRSNNTESPRRLGEREFIRVIELNERYVDGITYRIGILSGCGIKAVHALPGRDQCGRSNLPPLCNREEERPALCVLIVIGGDPILW